MRCQRPHLTGNPRRIILRGDGRRSLCVGLSLRPPAMVGLGRHAVLRQASPVSCASWRLASPMAAELRAARLPSPLSVFHCFKLPANRRCSHPRSRSTERCHSGYSLPNSRRFRRCISLSCSHVQSLCSLSSTQNAATSIYKHCHSSSKHWCFP